MAAADTARLIASLELRDKMSGGLKTANSNLGKFESRWDKLGGKIKAGFAIGATGLAVFGASQIKAGLESLTQLENAVGQVDGALEQVAPTWTTTGEDIARIANRIEANVQAAFDDKEIVAGAGALIRYGKVSEANLEPALQVMTDLAAKTGSVEGASSLLAKALADPAKAAGKLSKIGVILTKQQQDQIKVMTEAGDVAGAQTVLLDALSKTTEGAARNMFGPAADAQNELNDAVEDGQKVFAEGFLPVITRVREALQKGLADPATMGRIRDLGRALADGFDTLLDIAGKVPWGTIGDSLAMAGQGAKAVLQAFTSLPPWVQTAVITGWGLNKLTGGALTGIVGELGKGLIKGVLGMTAGVVNLKAATVVGAPGMGGAAAGAGKAGMVGRVGGALATLGTVAIAAGSIALLAQTFSDFNAGNEAAKAQLADQTTEFVKVAEAPALLDAIRGVEGRLGGDLPPIQAAIMSLDIGGVRTAVENTRSALLDQYKATQETTTSLEDTRAQLGLELEKNKTAVDQSKERITAAAQDTALQAQRAGERSAGATQIGSSNIVAAVNNIPAPVTNVQVNVNAVGLKSATTQVNRNGPGNPSRTNNRGENEFG